MNEEEAESAESGPGKPLGRFDLFSPCILALRILAFSTSACSATSAVKFFYLIITKGWVGSNANAEWRIRNKKGKF
jgi:hypothetical protein